MSRWALEITLLDISGVAGLEQCLDKVVGCDTASIDLTVFTVTLQADGPYLPNAWASKFSPGGPGIRNFPAQCAPSTSSRKGVLGRFGKLLKLYSIVPSQLPAAGGYVTIAGRGFGWNPNIITVLIDNIRVSDFTLPRGWSYPVPQLMAQTLVGLVPPGTGARGKRLTVTIQDEFSDSSFSSTLSGLLFYAPPVVSQVTPSVLPMAALQAFEAKQYVITIRGVNFGISHPVEISFPAPQVMIYTEEDGVHACNNITHESDNLVTCVHIVSPRMRTGGARARVAVRIDGQESDRSGMGSPCACEIRYEVK